MSYVFDIYRGQQKPVRNFVDYAVFVSFFPLLVAGPIERANHLLPQVQKARTFNYQQALEGCRLILWGLFKKVVIADTLAGIVDQIYQNPAELNSFTLILGAIGFSFQIYGDFSGYSDIALGTAKLFGFELLSNFKFPYFSRDLAEFWRRWHISLSSWFRDYLYIPLGGSKNGKAKAIRNTFIIFLVSGFWHGASWNFIVWGLIHACGFLPLLLLNKNRQHTTDVVAQDRMLPTWKELFQLLSTFTFVTFAWIFFRAETLSGAALYLQTLCTKFNTSGGIQGTSVVAWGALLLLLDWYLRHNERSLRVPAQRILRNGIYFVFALAVLLKLGSQQSFIYFQF
jgi:D-alanyl-lipoteichoic acid acyltransferase DltB (MBOAT superfamily)